MGAAIVLILSAGAMLDDIVDNAGAIDRITQATVDRDESLNARLLAIETKIGSLRDVIAGDVKTLILLVGEIKGQSHTHSGGTE